MNENTKKFLKQFKKGIKLTSVFEYLKKSDADEIHIFLKAADCFDNRNLRQQAGFWRSQLPVLHFKSLIKSDLKEHMLCSFFSNNRFINNEFFQLLVDSKPDLLIMFSKLSKSFLEDDYMLFYEQILKQHSNIKLRNLFHEFNFLNKRNKEWNDKETEMINGIKHYSIEEILIQTSSFLEIYKRADFSHLNNSSNLISFSSNLKLALNRLFTKIDSTDLYSNIKFISKFKKDYKSQLPPIKPAKDVLTNTYSPIENVSASKKDIRDTLVFLMDKLSFEYKMDNYAVGFADFYFIDDVESALSQNLNFVNHRKNIKKYNYTDSFFSNKGITSDKPNQKFYNINGALSYWNYLKLPFTHVPKDSETTFDIKKALLLLYTFSSWIVPLKRSVVTNGEKVCSTKYAKVPAPNEFKALFSREYLNAFTYKDLCLKVSKYFSWTISEVECMIDYLSTDLLNKQQNEKVDCYTSPFFRLGDNIYWMTNLYEDLKWECNLHQRIVKEGLEHNTQTANLEKSLAEDFKHAKIPSVPSHKYKFQKGDGTIKGEIDNLAYKDGYLLVIEMKTTYVEENPGQKGIYHSKTVEGKAKYQLTLACEYIKNNFHEIQSIKELKIDRDLSKIKIVPLIVSNIFDYDGEETENGILKVSDFTLRLILNNDWADLMFSSSKIAKQYLPPNTKYFDLPIISTDGMGNKDNPDFNPTAYRFPENRDKCNLWSSKNECSPHDLLSVIKQNKVWDFVDKIWDFKPSTTSITKP